MKNREKIGIIVGSGTGKELSVVFKRILSVICKIYNRSVEFLEVEHVFNTYFHLRELPLNEIRRRTKEDLKILSNFYTRCQSENCRVIFRTAINAETLYLFRRRYQAVKMVIMHKKNHRILIVRDETQGYYANDKWTYYPNKEKIHFEGCYEKENIARILKIAKKEADSKLRSGYKIWVVYKHHLFGNMIEKWVKKIEPQALLFQPNSMSQIFYEDYIKNPGEDLLIIMGNEIGDILHEIFLYSLNVGKRANSFNKTIFLSPKLHSLTEYQTVHGSADQIAGKNLVDPTATIRIAADIAEDFLKCEGIILTVEKAIENVKQNFPEGKQFDTLKFTEQVQDFIIKSSGYTL